MLDVKSLESQIIKMSLEARKTRVYKQDSEIRQITIKTPGFWKGIFNIHCVFHYFFVVLAFP